MVQNQ